MRKLIFVFSILLSLVLAAFVTETNFQFVIPKGFPKPVYDFKKNPLTHEKIELGRKLFYDPVLSKDSTISCATCHSPFTAFAHTDHALSHGIGGKFGNRNAPSLSNLAWGSAFMWDGAVNHLDMQALAPMSNPVEMDESIAHVVNKLSHSHTYRKLFFDAFGDSTITGEFVLKSLSQFMLTLVSADSKYDKVKRGETDFTPNELHGYKLFQKNCSSCHTEPLFTNRKFENNGLYVDATLKDSGRMKVTHNPDDYLKFKVPSLRNVQYTYPYMHDGRFKTLTQVINNYMGGIQQSATLSPKLKKGISFSEMEKSDLISFLYTLTDTAFLHSKIHNSPR